MAGGERRGVEALRTLIAGLFGLAILIGVPLALWRFIGNPIDLLPQSWDEARRMAQQRNVTSDLLLALLAVTMWLLWLQFVWATLWELLVVGPRAKRGQVARDAPGVPRFVRSIASAVTSGLLSASVVASASSAGSLLPDLVASAPVLASETYGDMMADETPLTFAANVQFYRITDTDRVWDLAGQNDATLQRILEMNADQVKSPIDFRPGMKIRVPASLALDNAVDEEAELDAVDLMTGALARGHGDHDPDGTLYEVVEGDNLWNISKSRLAENNGERPSNAEIVEEVAEVVERNPDVIEDPDLIYPGELLSLRAVGDAAEVEGFAVSEHAPTQPDTEAVETSGDHDSMRRPEERRSIDQTAPTDGTTVSDKPTGADGEHRTGNITSTTVAGTSREPVESKDEPTVQSVPVDSESADADSVDADSVDDVGTQEEDSADDDELSAYDDASLAPLFVGGAALSSALLGLYLAARRRSGGFSVAFSRRSGEPEEEQEATPPLLQAIARTADPGFMTWVAGRLDETLAGHGTSTDYPVAMVVTPGHRLEMQWKDPVVLTMDGWAMVDGEGRRWMSRYQPSNAPTPAPAAGGSPTTTAALPAMLSLGRVLVDESRTGASPYTESMRESEQETDAELLINLEHFGSMAVCGSTGQAFSAVRSMIFELGSGGQVCRTRVTTVDFEVEGADLLPTVSAAHESDALEAASVGTGDTGALLDVYVVQATGARLDRWFELARPGSGIALVLIGDVRSSRLGSRFVLDDDGTGEFHGLDARVKVFGLESATALALENTFRTEGFVTEPHRTAFPSGSSLEPTPG